MGWGVELGGGGLVTALQCVGVGEGGGIVICAKAVYWCVSGVNVLQSLFSVGCVGRDLRQG